MAINIHQKLSLFHEHWHPHVIAELNGQMVKLAKLKGEFVWHSHANEDELFYVVKGELDIHFRDRVETIREGEMIVVPMGIEHKPVAEEEVHVMLFEPAETINTGETPSELTRENLKKI